MIRNELTKEVGKGAYQTIKGGVNNMHHKDPFFLSSSGLSQLTLSQVFIFLLIIINVIMIIVIIIVFFQGIINILNVNHFSLYKYLYYYHNIINLKLTMGKR